MKKKYSATLKDKEDWMAFTKRIDHLYDKDGGFVKRNTGNNSIQKLDLHGFSLEEANNRLLEAQEIGYQDAFVFQRNLSVHQKVFSLPLLLK